MNIKICDCFTFYNEIDLLIYRLNILYNIVDYFIIVEATHTHVGKEKKLYFEENKHLFNNFKDKIIHIIVDDFPFKGDININNSEQWVNENFQRDCISRGLLQIQNFNDDDIIIITDLDEIPDPNTLNNIKNKNILVDINSLELDVYYYNLNTIFKYKWHLSKIICYKKYIELNISCNSIRGLNAPRIQKGGWHLSYFGDSSFIQNKIKNFSHQEYNNDYYTNLSDIEYKIKNNKDLYNRNEPIEKIEIENNNYLPIEYDKYLTKFYT